MLSHQLQQSIKLLQEIRPELKSGESGGGKTGRAADANAHRQAGKKANQRVKLVLKPKRQPGPGGKVRAYIEREIQVEEGLQPLLAEVSPVPGVSGPLDGARLGGLNDQLELIAVFADCRRHSKVSDGSRVLLKLPASNQFAQFETTPEEQTQRTAVIEALSGLRWETGNQQRAQEDAFQSLGGLNSSGPIETAPNPAPRRQSRWT
jgi:hypothetical protein